MKTINKRKDKQGRILRKGESQRQDNTYMYRWTDLRGVRNAIYSKTLNDLRQQEQAIAEEMSRGISRTSITLNEQIELYLNSKRRLQKSTLSNYWFYYKHSIRDSAVGKMQIIKIRKSNIMRFYEDCLDTGMKSGTIRILQKIIKPALDMALEDDLIIKNPAKGCTSELPDDATSQRALSIVEENEFINRIERDPRMRRYAVMYRIELQLGLRIGELLGLTWNDIDMIHGAIDINHQIQYRVINQKSVLYAGPLKTKSSYRVIPMNNEVMELFKEQRKLWMASPRDGSFELDGYKNFVFLSSRTGRVLYPCNVRRQMDIIVKQEKIKVELPHISPHTLRHTACTRMGEAGCDIRTLQYLMGHTKTETTMRIYNHVDTERVRREMERIDVNRRKIKELYA